MAAMIESLSDEELVIKSLEYRLETLRIIKQAGAGHTGGGLSSLDVLNVLYNRILQVSPASFEDPHRDRYVQSKGHCVEALYVVLADRGFFDKARLDELGHYRSHLIGHPTRKVAGIEHNTGALGHGLSVCVGMALAAQRLRSPARVYTLLGDGEMAEGSNWEAAMAAAHYRTHNLTAIIDFNTLQISGRTHEVLSSAPLDRKFEAFGWEVRHVDGHSIAELTDALQPPSRSGSPVVVIARTIKGKGVSFMEDIAKWHHGVPSNAEYENAIKEIDRALIKARESMS